MPIEQIPGMMLGVAKRPFWRRNRMTETPPEGQPTNPDGSTIEPPAPADGQPGNDGNPPSDAVDPSPAEQAAATEESGELPVWDIATQGPPNPDTASQYRVINSNG